MEKIMNNLMDMIKDDVSTNNNKKVKLYRVVNINGCDIHREISTSASINTRNSTISIIVCLS